MSACETRFVAADHPDREACDPADALGPFDLSVATAASVPNDCPIEIIDSTGKVIARVREPIHVSMFVRALDTSYWARIPSLPREILRRLRSALGPSA